MVNKRVIEKTMEACRLSRHAVVDHFPQMGKMVDIGSGAVGDGTVIHHQRHAMFTLRQAQGERNDPVLLWGLKQRGHQAL